MKVIKIKVSPDAKGVIEAIARREDMKEQGVASRIYEWFGHQPESIQKAILGHYPQEIAGEVARLILERIARGDDAPGGSTSGLPQADPTPPSEDAVRGKADAARAKAAARQVQSRKPPGTRRSAG